VKATNLTECYRLSRTDRDDGNEPDEGSVVVRCEWRWDWRVGSSRFRCEERCTCRKQEYKRGREKEDKRRIEEGWDVGGEEGM
jgi:hypothetical protein